MNNHVSLFGRHISLSVFMPMISEILHTSVCIQNTYAHQVLSDSHKYFTFVSHIFPCIYDPFNIHLAVIFVFITITFWLQFINVLHWAAYLFLHINDNLCIPCLVAILLFSLFIPITYVTVQTCLSINNKSSLIPLNIMYHNVIMLWKCYCIIVM